jgi:hypothetical protein
MLPMNIFVIMNDILILLPYEYYCGLTGFSYFIFPECLRGWLDYPGHSILFSRPLVASLEFTGGPATTLVDTRLAFLFKSNRGVT